MIHFFCTANHGPVVWVFLTTTVMPTKIKFSNQNHTRLNRPLPLLSQQKTREGKRKIPKMWPKKICCMTCPTSQ